MKDSAKLTIKFLTEVKQFPRDNKNMIQAPEAYKDTIWESFEKFLLSGVTADEMDAWLDQYIATHPTPKEAYTIADIISYLKVDVQKRQPIVRKVNPDNLLEAGRFYYHPALQIAPPPPVITINNDGTFSSSYDNEEEFFLEMKEEFTLEDLVDYYYTRFPDQRKKMERDKGAFKYLLKSADLDVILYCIEEGSRDEDPPRSILELDDYEKNARLILQDRQNTLYEVGLDHVIPR